MSAGLLAAAALLGTWSAPAQATTRGGAAADWLLLTVSGGANRAGAGDSTVLFCDPPSGHARAARACAELDAADGRIAGIAAPGEAVPCPMIHAPVTAHARGEWKGHRVEYTRTFPNACVMAAATGSVFALDRRAEG
ncbi:hypothetical protein GCM10023220_70910 [Streptomyces ziwulingensis]|uniref:Subtilisin inhibitor domain-containing protein n=1 Tax=Streptomyces ziwulingensis TaxID=1045501 RepID=A0ABP9D3C6_9ACTN